MIVSCKKESTKITKATKKKSSKKNSHFVTTQVKKNEDMTTPAVAVGLSGRPE